MILFQTGKLFLVNKSYLEYNVLFQIEIKFSVLMECGTFIGNNKIIPFNM